jgi:hypothetical protein
LQNWTWVLGVKLMGVANDLHIFEPIMLKQNIETHQVNTASLAGLIIG